MLRQHPQENQANSEEAQIQRYLDDLQKPMGTLGETAQQEWRSEAEAHLRNMITAYEELGENHEAATRLALARFGQPQRIGFRMHLATLRKLARQNPENQITNYVMRCGAAFVLPALVSFLVFILLYVYTENHAAQVVAHNAAVAFFLLGPLLSGWLLGGRFPWLWSEWQRVTQVHGPQGLLRLRFGLVAVVISTTLQLGLFWSLLRTLSAGDAPNILATDFLPSLIWLPLTLAAAYGRSCYTQRLPSQESGR